MKGGFCAKTPSGKAKISRNAFKGATRAMLRLLAKALRGLEETPS